METGDRDIGFRCHICHQSAEQGPVVTLCGHLYCQSCSCTWVRPVHVCPICDARLDPRTGLLPIRPSGVRVATVSVPSFIVK
ncbi:putative transcription factor C2H2 family [Rosa chinensis]|uniref:E3 ubiquitin-protein ligase RMA n=1 Tax=Rosa chinensis TaxID=74649 RepID=A0A2P6PNM8_ROSCH|nr:putative transcription factor C2H2 family [Rosa chinensis]